MTGSGTEERSTVSRGSGERYTSPGGRNITRPSFPFAANRSEEEVRAVAGIERQGHESDMIFVVKRDSTVLHVSFPDSSTPAGGVVGRSILGLFALEFSADIIRSFESVFALGEPQSFVCCGNPPLSVGSWYRCRVSPNHGESGVESATVFVRDITEWKHNEAEFRAEIAALRSQIAELSSENENLTDLLTAQEQHEEELSRFREIMNHAGEAIFITDPHTGRFLDVNETACRWLGCNRDRLLQMGVGDLDLEFPLESGDGEVDHVADTRESNRPKALVFGSHRRRNGTSFPVEVTISPRLFGDRDCLLVVARDVKQRSRPERTSQEGENERRDLSDISRDAVYTTARDGTVREVNDSALDLFGYAREEFLGLDARRLYLYPERISEFKRAVEERGSVKNVRTEFKTKSGRWFQGFFGAILRYNANGVVQGYQCVISPVGETTGSERAIDILLPDPDELEREAEKAKRDLEEARTEGVKARQEAERAKDEVAQAKSEAAQARAQVEQTLAQLAQAKSEAEGAKERADALKRDAERAERELEEAKSEAARAGADVEQTRRELDEAKSESAESKLRAEVASQQAARAEADVVAAQLEIEKAKLEIARAKLDVEEAQERARQLEREAEPTITDTHRAVCEAVKACAGLEGTGREIPALTSSTTATNSESGARQTGSGIRVHVKQPRAGDTPSNGGGETPLLVARRSKRGRRREPELWAKESKWPAIWLGLVTIAIIAITVGLLVLWPR